MKFSMLKNALKITIVFIFIFLSMSNISNAKSIAKIETRENIADAKFTTVTFKEWKNQADNFIERGSEDEKISPADAIRIFLPIGKILVGIATIVLIVVGLVMGVKYMIAGANDKAQLKQKLIYYIISIVLVYGAVGIFNIIVNIMKAITA